MYAVVIGKIDNFLERFRGVNKALLQAVVAGAAALVSSMCGLGFVTFLLAPSRWPILHVGLWDAFLGLGIGLSVAVVQSWHLQRLAVAGADLLKAGALSAFGGFLAGGALVVVRWAAGLVFGALGGGASGPHILGWTVEGLIIGFFVARAIPNLESRAALLAGAAAGFLGGVLTSVYVPVALGDVFKGVFLGLGVAVAEQVVKKAWIILRREVPEGAAASRSLVLLEQPPTLLLGEQQLLIGSSKECEVFVDTGGRGPSTIASIALRDGAIVYDDRIAESRRTLHHGDQIRLQGLTLEVGSKLAEATAPEAVATS